MPESPYSPAAELYDFINLHSDIRDYDAEARLLIEQIQTLYPEARTILDIACATGEHARRLSAIYQVDGIDLAPEFIALAQQKNPQGRFTCADMLDFDLGRQYDILLCLSGSVGYLRTPENLLRAFQSFRRHLAPGGYILVEPWFTPTRPVLPDEQGLGKIAMVVAEAAEQKVCRMVYSRREMNRSVLDFVYLVGSRSGIQLKKERHELGLFSMAQMTAAFEEAGLHVAYYPGGLSPRGLYIAALHPLLPLTPDL